jgi:secondary thiamine-phosphate synthase enzyme
MSTMSVSLKQGAIQKTYHDLIELKTQACLQFIDITDLIIERVQRAEVWNGWANVQSKHTTATILLNENEPLLLEDMKKVLEDLAPRNRNYKHDDFSIRTANLSPGEHQNGHSHCKAMFLRASETLNIVDGEIELGPWQRIFFIELDRARERSVSVMVLGYEA